MTTPPATRPAVVYDDGCEFCLRQQRRIQQLDWLHRFEYVGYETAAARWPEVGRGALGDGLRVRHRDGTVTVGVDAVRSIGMRLPVTALVSWLLWVPGVHAIAHRAYRFVAARRHRL